MATRIQLRRDTAANWAEANPALAMGEAGFDVTNNQLRIGDGERNWNALTPLDGSNIDLSIYATQSALNTETATRAAADLQHTEDIEGLQLQIDAINEGGGGPGGGGPDGPIALIYRGTTYWPSTLAQGDAMAHPDDATLFLPTLDLNGFDLETFLDEFVNAGTTFLITEVADKNRWVHFEATGSPQNQNWGRNIPTTRIGGKFAIREDREVSMVIDLAHAGTFDQARWEGVEEMLATMKKQISSLKGEITKLKKANG